MDLLSFKQQQEVQAEVSRECLDFKKGGLVNREGSCRGDSRHCRKEVTAERQEEVEVKIFPGCGSLHLETGLSGTLVLMK